MKKLLLFIFFSTIPLFSKADPLSFLSAPHSISSTSPAFLGKSKVLIAEAKRGSFHEKRAKIGFKTELSQFLIASRNSASSPAFVLGRRLPTRFLIAQDEDSFVEEDFKDIEGEEDDRSLEKDFDSLAGEEAPDNFDEDDFEIEDDEEEEEEEEEEDEEEEEEDEEMDEDDFDEMDYEPISEDPDYEISDEEDDEGVDDKELERDFEEEEEEEEEDDEEEGEEEFDLEEEELTEDDLSLPEDELPPSTEEEEDLMEEESFEPDSDEEDPAFEEDSSIDSASGALNLVSNIRYLAERDQIIIDCSEPVSYQARKNEENNQLILEIMESKLGSNLHWPYVLRDFDTDFGLIKADQKDSSTTRIVIQMKDEAKAFPENVLSEDGNQILVGFGDLSEGEITAPNEEGARLSDSILPEKTLEDLYFGKLEFSGAPISFHVIDAPIKQVLRFISEESGLNMVIGETVQGTVTLKLEDVPWDQALYTIFKVKSLGYTRDGNVITVLPLSDIEQRAKKLREISEREVSLVPYQTKVIPVNYGSLDDIKGKIKTFSTKQTDLTVGGQIILNKESGALIIIDTPKVIKKISDLVKYLDKPPRQVMVEAKIVDASENFTSKFGLTWNLGDSFPITLKASGIADIFSNIPKDVTGNWSGSMSNEGTPLTSLRINGLPFVGDISAALDLAESENYAQVISSPKVVVISGKEATITRNSPILVPTATIVNPNVTGEDGAPTTTETQRTEDVSTDISVTPTVTAGGSVFLKVDVTRSDPGGKGGAFKTTRSASTEVLVKNGQTVVIGGIYDQDESKTGSGFNFLRRVPVLSWLFGVKSTTRFKAELLVFITPKVLDNHE